MARAAAQPRRCDDVFHKRHDLRWVGSPSWAKNALLTQDLMVRFSSRVLLAEPFQVLGLLVGQPLMPVTTVRFVLTHPLTQRLSLGADPRSPHGDRAAF
jgi:hypothetical protein